MRVRVGTSGYQYKFWRGTLYGEKCREADMLGEYGQKLGTVEINNTFYRMPKREVVARWASQVPDDFRFAIKASRRITHLKRLKDVGEPLEFLVANVAELGDKLGSVLFQLPPSLKCDLARLETFLVLVAQRVPVAMEFRHVSWFDEPTFALLRAHGAALCISDEGEGEAATPHVATAGFGYLRLRREQYSPEELQAVVARVRAEAWSDAYVYFKHEEGGAALALGLQAAFDSPPG
jgi:uncharacterized protein YecE (DUF72 family)